MLQNSRSFVLRYYISCMSSTQGRSAGDYLPPRDLLFWIWVPDDWGFRHSGAIICRRVVVITTSNSRAPSLSIERQRDRRVF